MSDLDAPDCLARVKRELKRPSSDAAQDDTDLYQLLTEGCRKAQEILARHGFEHNAIWEQATTSDTITYSILYEPVGPMEARDGRTGRLLMIGPDGHSSTDLVWTGEAFLIPEARTKTFSNGLWIRYTPEHGVVNATTAPTLKPTRARLFAIYHAAHLWLDRGGFRDIDWIVAKKQEVLFGDGQGDTGIIGRKQPWQRETGGYSWHRSPDYIYPSGS
jgi:hypothetical protein